MFLPAVDSFSELEAKVSTCRAGSIIGLESFGVLLLCGVSCSDVAISGLMLLIAIFMFLLSLGAAAFFLGTVALTCLFFLGTAASSVFLVQCSQWCSALFAR